MDKRLRRYMLLLALGLLLAMGCAFAETEVRLDYPLNPYFETVHSLEPVDSEVQPESTASVRVDLVSQTGAYFTEDTTWTFRATGGTGGYQFRYYVVDENEDPSGYKNYSSATSYTYRVVAPGSYEVWIWARDSAGTTGFLRVPFTATDNSRQTVGQKVQALALECLAAGCADDFEKALWLHDWLTMNAKYDYTYSYYGPDGVLFRGTGVCDSYSKAYMLLLRAVGIECERLTGGNHAWNMAKLDGEWYQIDATWDDPNSSDGPVSGWEQHLYFCLPDEIMQVDHSYTPTVPCGSMELNYFIHTGKHTLWTNALSADLAERLQNGVYTFAVEAPERYPIEAEGYSSRGKGHIVYNVSAYALSRRANWRFGKESVALNVAYEPILQQVVAAVDFGDRVLRLPAQTRCVEAEAFADGAFMAVEIPAGTTAIGENAFAGCQKLWKVYMPASVTQIAATAFPANGHLTIACPSGSAAEAFATANGISCVNE